jgi:asparagine synthase (glutamine-hydrolysing)
MCGIIGAIGKFDKSQVEKGLTAIAHRGPDGVSLWEDSPSHVVLGHRRLAILDLSPSGKQPMTDDNLTITYNGEIYNYKELRSELEGHGHLFNSKSDTEVILKAFRQWGHRCLEKMNGMWAFAIWNATARTLFLARDRFGVKPLLYAFTSNGFIFSSEMKAIAPLLNNIEISADFNWCRDNIYNYETTDKTLIQDIKRFPAGHFAYFSSQHPTLKVTRYWDTLSQIEPVEVAYEKQVEKFRELFFDACKIRMRSDVKIGTALSGGLDSSSVAAAMHYIGTHDNSEKVSADWQNAFVATFTGTALDEKEYAEAMVRSLNLKGHFFEIDPSKSLKDLDDHLWFFEELFLTSPSPMIEIYKGIKSHGVSVSLDGHGADELLSGYGNMLFHTIKDEPFNFKNMKEIVSTYRQLRHTDKSTFTLLIDGFEGRKNMLKFYLQKVFSFLRDEDPLIEKLGYFNATLYKEFHYYILPTLLRNYDRYSMAAGVEVRMPFMDYRLVSYCFSIPWQSKVKGGFTKSILRDAMQPYLPERIAKRKSKIGFGTPFTNWFSGPWKEFVLSLPNDTSFKNAITINHLEVSKAIDGFYKKPNPSFEDGNQVWEKLMPYLWEQAFFNKLKSVRLNAN